MIAPLQWSDKPSPVQCHNIMNILLSNVSGGEDIIIIL
jgi:hypothetical protein